MHVCVATAYICICVRAPRRIRYVRLRHLRMYMTFYACPSYVIFTTECQCENLNFRPRQCGVASTHRCIFSMKTTIWVLKTQNFFWPHGADGHRAKKWWKSWGMRQNRGGVTAGTAVTRECRASSPIGTRGITSRSRRCGEAKKPAHFYRTPTRCLLRLYYMYVVRLFSVLAST